MILIGQYDSPFVRRVAVALGVYDLPYEHWPWSTFGDAERLSAYNPLRRVPTVILGDGEVLIDSAAILDHLDEIAGSSSLMPPDGSARRAALKVCALATGLCDKMVSLVYEHILHDVTSKAWITRCEVQISAVLDVLEADRASRSEDFWFGDRLGHADIAVTCALRFLGEAHSSLASQDRWPRLADHAMRCEEMDAFRRVVQRFDPPRR